MEYFHKVDISCLNHTRKIPLKVKLFKSLNTFKIQNKSNKTIVIYKIGKKFHEVILRPTEEIKISTCLYSNAFYCKFKISSLVYLIKDIKDGEIITIQKQEKDIRFKKVNFKSAHDLYDE